MISNTKIDIIPFLQRFFKAKHCPILFTNDTDLHVQLTVEMDKALMNRPFYWHYIKATGRSGEPRSLFLTTKQTEKPEQEWIHHGSPRLEQIYQTMLQENEVIQLFEVQHVTEQTMLQPWLLTNYCVAFQGKQKKEMFFSIGLNLINGTIVHNMMDRLNDITLSPSISAYCYIISPIIKVQSGYKRIEKLITEKIHMEDHDWANVSINEMEEETQMANYFYDNLDDKRIKEITSIQKRLQPTITHHVINGGVFFLSKNFSGQQIKK